MSSSTSQANNNHSVRTWLKSLLAKDKEKDPISDPSTDPSPKAPPSDTTSQPDQTPDASVDETRWHSVPMDMISFHHSVTDADDDHPFSPPARSFSGGSGPISYRKAAQATNAARQQVQQPQRQPPSSDAGSSSFSTNLEPPSPTLSPQLSSSPSSRSICLARTLSQGVQSFHERRQHRKRASETFKRFRAGSDAGSDVSESSTAQCNKDVDKPEAILSTSQASSARNMVMSSSIEKIEAKLADFGLRSPKKGSEGLALRSVPSSPSSAKPSLPSILGEPSSPLPEAQEASKAPDASLLLPEGEPMLKVTNKKVKQQTFKLYPDRGQIVWASKKNNKVSLETIREVRFGSSAASYRSALNISSTHEPRWLTIIYQIGGIYKALHLIALSDASLSRWRSSLLHLQNLRRELIEGISPSGSLDHRRDLWMRHHWQDADESNDEKLSMVEVLKLCRRLGIENSRSDLHKSFVEADWRKRGFLDFEDFQTFVRLLKRREDVELIFSQWANVELMPKAKSDAAPASSPEDVKEQVAKPPVVLPESIRSKGLGMAAFTRFLREEQQCTGLSDTQISELFVRHCSGSIFPASQSGTDSAMTFEGFLSFLTSSDNPPLVDQLPLLNTPAGESGPAAATTTTKAKAPTSGGTAAETLVAPKPADTDTGKHTLRSPASTSSLSSSVGGAAAPPPPRAHAETAEDLVASGASNSNARKVPAHLRRSAVNQDMSRPLSDYFISSSHNTYLVGGQWKGDSTVEGYIRALLQGARSVELDCWDGPNMTPHITHGRTLTSKVPFADVISAIARYAFVTSPYPLILSLEVHNDVPQQKVMAKILKDVLGDALLSKRLDLSMPVAGDQVLPSPDALKYKVLVKAKNLYVAEEERVKLEKEKSAAADVQAAVVAEAHSTSATDTTEYENDAILFNARELVRRVTKRRNKADGDSGVVAPNTDGKAPKVLMSAALASLLIYTIGVKCRGLNKKEVYANQHMFSLSERTALKFIRDPATRESLIKHNRTHLSRVYPSMSSFARLHSSRNFLPLDMWAAGCQLVAMNWQTMDLGFEINQAMFTRNGRCGYVLKPPGLCIKEQMKESGQHLRFCLDLKIISAQQLPRKGKDPLKDKDTEDRDPLDPFIAVSLLAPVAWGKQPPSFVRDSSSESSLATLAFGDKKAVKTAIRQARRNPQRSSSLPIEMTQGGAPSSDSVMKDDDHTADPALNTGTETDAQDSTAPHHHLETNIVISSVISEEPEDEAPTPTLERRTILEAQSEPIIKVEGDGVSQQVGPSNPDSALTPRFARSRLRTPTIKGNGFSPHWNTSMSIHVQVPAGTNLDMDKMEIDKLSRGLLDLCFLRFEVYDEDLGGSDASSNTSNSSFDSDCVAAYVVPMGSLQQGYRHLPLYDAQLSQHLFSTLFVHTRVRFVGLTGKKNY